MEEHNDTLKDALVKIEEIIDMILKKLDQKKLKDAALMLNEIFKGLDSIYLLLESNYQDAKNYEDQLNSLLDKVVSSYEKGNIIIIKMNMLSFKKKINELSNLI